MSSTANYNGTWQILSVDSSTTFTVSRTYTASNTSGSWELSTNDNVALGTNAGLGTCCGYASTGNVLIGSAAAQNIRTGSSYNTIMGYSAGNLITTGANNLLLGKSAGANLTTGSNNIILGAGVNAPSATGSNQLQIGSYITGVTGGGTSTTAFQVQDASSNSVLDVDNTNSRVGIGTNAPAQTLDLVTASGNTTLGITGYGGTTNTATTYPTSASASCATICSGATNVYASDGAIYSTGAYSGTLTATDTLTATSYFNGSSIPSNATITGIVVGVKECENFSDILVHIWLQKQGGSAVGGKNAAFSVANGITCNGGSGTALDTYGSNSDLWGSTWTPADFNGTNFGVQYQSYRNSSSSTNVAYVDSITVTVYYLVPQSFTQGVQSSTGSYKLSAGTALGTNDLISASSDGTLLALQPAGGKVAVGGSSASYLLDVQNSATGYAARIYNASTASVAATPASSSDGLLIQLGTANASRTTGNYFVAFAGGTSGSGTVAGKIQGGASAVAYTTTGADYAEYFKADPDRLPQPGEIVSLGSAENSVVRSGSNPVGIVSSNPGFIGNGPLCNVDDKNCDSDYAKYNVLVALSGQVPAKVSAANGAIHVGDPITASSVAGVGMKATVAGQIVGYALESTSQDGVIKVMIQPGFWSPDNAQVMQGGNAVLGDVTIHGSLDAHNLNIGGMATLASLSVTGNSSIGGDLTVAGTTTVADIVVNGHVITGGDAPKVTTLDAAGTNASVTIDGNDTSGTITIVTGDPAVAATKSTPAIPAPTSGDLLQLMFVKAFGKVPHILLSASDSKSATLQVYPVGRDQNGFKLSVNGTPEPNTTYTFDYWVAE